MAKSSPNPKLDPDPQDTPADRDQAGPKTWWDKHAAVVIAVGAFLLVALLMAFNMK